MRGDVPSRVDILPDGRVYVTAGGNDGWLSFDGIIFSVKVTAEQAPELSNGWVSYGGGYRSVSAVQYKNLCILSGVVRSGNWNQPFGRVPQACAPGSRLLFSANNHVGVARVDVANTGHFFYAGGANDHGWLSLDGMAWVAAVGGLNLQLANKWQNFLGDYRPARYELVDNLCVLSGLIRNDNDWTETIVTLPPVCRPEARLIFAVNVHTSSARIDVYPNGNVQYVTGKTQWPWTSLDGIRFVVKPPPSKA